MEFGGKFFQFRQQDYIQLNPVGVVKAEPCVHIFADGVEYLLYFLRIAYG